MILSVKQGNGNKIHIYVDDEYRATVDSDYWYSEKYAVHNSYVCEGQFNCIIRYSSSDVGHADKGTECNFLLVGEAGGKGTIDTVYYNPNKVSVNDDAKDYLINDPIF